METMKLIPMTQYNAECWRDVVGYEGYYEISSFGNLRSKERFILASDGRKCYYPSKTLKAFNTEQGYKKYRLTKNGEGKGCFAHRLLMIAFVSNPENKPQVNHVDGNKSNNHISNLEWSTSSDNIKHSFKTGLRPMKYVGGKPDIRKPIIQYSLNNIPLKIWSSSAECGSILGIDSSGISKACKGNQKSAGGYLFRYC